MAAGRGGGGVDWKSLYTGLIERTISGEAVFPSGLATIGEHSFRGLTWLTTADIPSTVTSIGANAFNSCTRLANVTIPNSVTTIGSSAFYACPIVNLVIPDSVTTIGNTAFQQIGVMLTAELGSGITSIGNNAFVNCTKLTYVKLTATTPPTLGSGVFNNTNNCPIYVPDASVNDYKAESGWSTYASRIFPLSDLNT